jgi:hypothetical protein
MEKIFVKPAPGLAIRNMDRAGYPLIATDGQWVAPSMYIRRRLRAGDLVAPPRSVKPAQPVKKPEPKGETK